MWFLRLENCVSILQEKGNSGDCFGALKLAFIVMIMNDENKKRILSKQNILIFYSVYYIHM